MKSAFSTPRSFIHILPLCLKMISSLFGYRGWQTLTLTERRDPVPQTRRRSVVGKHWFSLAHTNSSREHLMLDKNNNRYFIWKIHIPGRYGVQVPTASTGVGCGLRKQLLPHCEHLQGVPWTSCWAIVVFEIVTSLMAIN